MSDFYMNGNNNIYVQNEVANFKIANVTVSVFDKKNIPNKFVRFMQKHILGIEWYIKEGGKNSD